MKLYILHMFGDEHKMWNDSNVIGYFTRLGDLAHVIIRHKDELGISDKAEFLNALATDIRQACRLMEKGDVEVTTLNEDLTL